MVSVPRVVVLQSALLVLEAMWPKDRSVKLVVTLGIITIMGYALVNNKYLKKIYLIFVACTALDAYCTTCTSSTQCTSCSNSRVAQGSVCQLACNSGFFNNNGICTACTTLNGECLTCNSTTTCLSCDNGKYASGATCVSSCPSNTFENAGICTGKLFDKEGKN